MDDHDESLAARESSVNPALSGIVYILRADGTDMVKIGWTNGTVANRIQQIRPGSTHDLICIREVPGARDVEGWFHRRFSERRIEREWFRFDLDMLTVTPDLEEIRRWNAAKQQRQRRPQLLQEPGPEPGLLVDTINELRAQWAALPEDAFRCCQCGSRDIAVNGLGRFYCEECFRKLAGDDREAR